MTHHGQRPSHNAAFAAYILTNHRMGTLYTGHTDSLGKRILEHRDGRNSAFASAHGLHHLVWFEEFATRDQSFARERRIKKWQRAWKVRLIEAANPHWLSILECPTWPVPDEGAWPEIHRRCMATALPRVVRGGSGGV